MEEKVCWQEIPCPGEQPSPWLNCNGPNQREPPLWPLAASQPGSHQMKQNPSPLSVTSEVSQRTHHGTNREQECPASTPLLSGSCFFLYICFYPSHQAPTAGTRALHRQPRLCLDTIPHQRGSCLSQFGSILGMKPREA